MDKCECGNMLLHCIICGNLACMGDKMTMECGLTSEQELHGEVCCDCKYCFGDLPDGFSFMSSNDDYTY